MKVFLNHVRKRGAEAMKVCEQDPPKVVLILKVHDVYDAREVRPTQGEVKEMKFRA